MPYTALASSDSGTAEKWHQLSGHNTIFILLKCQIKDLLQTPGYKDCYIKALNFTWKVSGETKKKKEFDKASHHSQIQCNTEIQQLCTSCHLFWFFCIPEASYLCTCASSFVYHCLLKRCLKLHGTGLERSTMTTEAAWKQNLSQHQTQNMSPENLFFDTVLQR